MSRTRLLHLGLVFGDDGPRRGHPPPDSPAREPSERTEFRVIYDDVALYIGVWCHDSEPEKIIALEMARDGYLLAEDHLIVVLDTFHDRRNGYEFLTNPNAARADALITNNVNVNGSWDGIWEVKARIDQEGWKAEFAIPFKTLSFNPDSPTWGLNISRTIGRKSETVRWSGHRPDLYTYNVAEAGVLAGLQGLHQGLGLEFQPYVLGRFTDDRLGRDDDLELEAGGDIRYRITPNLAATLSYNTDFAETEVDLRQINLTRFPLFFPEKREFFLEDSGIFQFGGLGTELIPYFSRRIGLNQAGEVVPITVAGKLTGRFDDYNVGVIDALLDTDDHGMRNAFVGRVSRNVFDQASLGMIATVGDPDSSSDNVLGGADFSYRTTSLFGDNILVANTFLMGSYTAAQEDSDSLAFGANFEMPNDLYTASAGFYQVDENFNPALGFAPRRGVRNYNGARRRR